MDRACEFRRQQRIYHTMTLDPALPFERFRYDIDPEMCLAARPMARVALMQMGFIGNIEAFGCESFAQLLCDVIFYGHDLRNIVRYSLRSMTVSIAVRRRGDVYSALVKNRVET
jgi:hypothetical protein